MYTWRCMSVYVRACMDACTHLCTNACMRRQMHGCMDVWLYGYLCIDECMHLQSYESVHHAYASIARYQVRHCNNYLVQLHLATLPLFTSQAFANCYNRLCLQNFRVNLGCCAQHVLLCVMLGQVHGLQQRTISCSTDG